MTAPITIRVVGRSDSGFFIGSHKEGYCIFNLGDTHEIFIGDQLLGDFHGHSASTFAAQNLTQRNRPWIDLYDGESPLNVAIGHLLRLGSPRSVEVGMKRIPTDADDIVRQVRDEILRF